MPNDRSTLEVTNEINEESTSFGDWLELNWGEQWSLQTVTTILKLGQAEAVIQEQLQSKRSLIRLYKEAVAVGKILKKRKMNVKEIISFEELTTACEDESYSMTLFRTLIMSQEKSILSKCLIPTIREGTSAASGIPTTSTSYTTADMQGASVSALDSSEYPLRGMIGECFGAIASGTNIGGISQSIVYNHQDSLYTLKLEGQKGYYLVRLDIYPAKDLHNVDKNNWWRHSILRSAFLTSSPLDPVQLKIDDIVQTVTKRINENDLTKKEVKKKAYFNFYGNTRHAPY